MKTTAILKLPKTQLLLILFLFWLIAVWKNPSWEKIVGAILLLGFSLLIESILQFIRKTNFFVSISGLVSTIIIISLVDYFQNFWVALLALTLALISKHFLKINNRQVFNPAALGIILASGKNVSWWLPAGTPWVLMLLFLGAVYRVKRLVVVISFLLVYFAGNFFIFPRDPTLFFFGLVMLVEPKTSPLETKRQIFFGLLVGFLAFALPKFGDPLLSALLIGNLLTFGLR